LTVAQISKYKAKRWVGLIFLNLLLVLGLLFTVIPLLWTVSSSFKTVADIFTYPPELIPPVFTTESYERLVTEFAFIAWFWNTLWVSVVATVLVVFFCALAGFAFAKYRFRGQGILFNIVISSMLIPFAVVLIPLFILVTRVGLGDSLWALIIPFVAPGYGIFMMRQFIIQSVPDEVLDAGRVDGATEFGIFWHLVLPMTRPALGALAIWSFIHVYNSFLWPLTVLSTNEKFTLPVGLASLLGTYNREYGLVMAGAVVAAIPMLVLFFSLRKQFIEGLTLGSVKG
jgi:multiple sugar transport system permease protein